MIKTISILGCGWLGAPLAEFLLSKNFQVNGSSRSAEKRSQLELKGINMFPVDIGNRKDINPEFLSCDLLISCITTKTAADVRYLIEEVIKNKVKKVIFTSSTSVYSSENLEVSEESPTEPTPLRNIELLFQNQTHFSTTILRMAGLIGPGRHPGGFFRSGRPISQPKNPINLIQQADCIAMYHRVIEHEAWGEIFNGAADEHPLKQDYYPQKALEIGLKTPQLSESDANASYKIVSNQKAKERLGMEFTSIYDH